MAEMRNSLLVVTLGVVFAICTYATTLAKTAQDDYKQTLDRISANEAVTTKYVTPVGFLAEYKIGQLKENYQPPTIVDGKKIINVPVINQYPELPTGCEITSATAMLNYLGFNVNKVYMQENFLESSVDFHYNKENKRVGPDPRKMFVGNPKDAGFGCYSSVIVDTLNKFFKANASNNYAINLVDADQSTLETLIDNGIPIEVWASLNMQPYKNIPNNQWILETTGENFSWPSNSHVLVLVGYDKDDYIFSDCNNNDTLISFKKTDFLPRWVEGGNQGVIIKVVK